MSTSVPPEQPRAQAPVPQTLADWFQLNSRYVTIGAAAIAVAALGAWFYSSQQNARAAQAEQALNRARQSIGSGNVQLGQTDLKRVVDGYGGTRAGVEAALLLAESYYAAGKFAEGIDVLDDHASSRTAEVSRAKIYSLIGDGRMELGKAKEAAADYGQAAEASRFEGERAQLLAKQARALGAAGDSAGARELWEDLSMPRTPGGVQAEARVRMGELEARRASRS